jgi:dolichol-phosphate mannosyltransferase
MRAPSGGHLRSKPVQSGAPLQLGVVIPTFKEAPNVRPLLAKLEAALQGVVWQAIFVDDDSPDGTAAVVKEIAATDPRVICLHRIGRRGLAGAVIEGAMASAAPFVAVIDGDMQHDETRLPAMLKAVTDGADLAIGSRHVAGGDNTGLASPLRVKLSNAGIGLAQMLAKAPVHDPMSGFFLLRRALFEQLAGRLTGQGFKILLDLMLASPHRLAIVEVPYKFRPRAAGESKLDALVLAQFAGLLIDKTLRGTVPLRFITFALVGGFGVLINVLVLELARRFGMDFGQAQTLGTIVAMIANFQLNNQLTYRAQRLKGARAWRGLLVFLLVCGLGAIANIGIARSLYAENHGGLLSGAAGAAISVVWNYAVSATLVWRVR